MIGILEQMNTIAWAEYDMRKGGGARCYYCFRSSLGWKFTYDEKTGDVTEIPSATKLLKRKVPQSPVKDDVHGELLAGRSQESGSMAGQAPYGILNTNEQSQDSDELDRLDQKAPSVSETPFSNISNFLSIDAVGRSKLIKRNFRKVQYVVFSTSKLVKDPVDQKF